MASWTEKYAAPADVGAGTGADEANAMDLATALTSASAGERWNCISGSYSIGATTVASGTAAAPIVFRGYKTTPGDLDAQGRNADGTLNTTDMPDITITGLWTPGVFSVFQNFDFLSTSLNSYMIGSTTVDGISVLNCNFLNQHNGSAAGCFQGDNFITIANCDFYCSGASHSIPVDADEGVVLYGCRIKTTDTDACLQINWGVVANSLFIGNGSSTGIVLAAGFFSPCVINCTFDGISTAISTVNSVNTGFPVLINNLVTDCTNYVVNGYSGTANIPIIDCNRRTRDTTNIIPATVLELTVGADDSGATGDDSTDYTNSGAGNYRPATSAPGRGTGMPAYMDKGAYQAEEAAGGGGTPKSFGFL